MPFKKAFHELTAVPSAGTIAWLDIARALAVTIVLGAHSIELGFTGLAADVFYWGWTGVDLFFVLSGFLIGRQLWSELHQTGNVNFFRFLLKRGFRIWPLYYVAVSAYFFWDCATHSDVRPLWMDLAYLSNYFHGQVKGGWSLSTEELFYLLLPLVMIALKRVPIRWLFLLPVTWLLLLPCLRLIRLAQIPAQSPGGSIYMPFHTHTDGLAVGLLVAWVSVVCGRWWNSDSGRIWLPVSMLVLGATLRLVGHEVLSYTAISLIYGAFVIAGVRRNRTLPFESWRGFHIMSRLSYGVYLNHLPIIEGLIPLLRSRITKTSDDLGMFLIAFIGLWIASLTIAFLTYSLVEKPLLDMRDRWLNSLRQRQALSELGSQHPAKVAA